MLRAQFLAAQLRSPTPRVRCGYDACARDLDLPCLKHMGSRREQRGPTQHKRQPGHGSCLALRVAQAPQRKRPALRHRRRFQASWTSTESSWMHQTPQRAAPLTIPSGTALKGTHGGRANVRRSDVTEAPAAPLAFAQTEHRRRIRTQRPHRRATRRAERRRGACGGVLAIFLWSVDVCAPTLALFNDDDCALRHSEQPGGLGTKPRRRCDNAASSR